MAADDADLCAPPLATPLRVLIVDDEPLALDGLAMELARLEGATVVGSASNADSALDAIGRLRPDVVLLDIQMPGLSGMELARRLPPRTGPDVVFVTAFDRYAPAAFDVEAVDFVLKPVDPARLREAMMRASRRKVLRLAAQVLLPAAEEPPAAKPASEPAYLQEIWVPQRHGMVRVPMVRIEWIEAARDYVLLHTEARTYLYRATMAGLGSQVDPKVMLRAHRSAFVNAAAVVEIRTVASGGHLLRLASGAEVRVGRMYAAAIMRALRP